MKQTRQAERAFKQSILLDVYGYIQDEIKTTQPMKYRPVTSWGDARSKCMHRPVMSWADHVVTSCTNSMGSKVLSLSWIYLYSSYFAV
jgi:hypothetical protein